MKVLITLTDVEPAVRLNARLEAVEIQTDVVSPLDDMRAEVRRFKPDVIVMTGGIAEPHNVALVREMLWDVIPVIGFADLLDANIEQRLRALGYTEVYAKPVVIDEVVAGVRRILDRVRLSRISGLYGASEPVREVLVKVEQMAPVSSTVLIEGESGTGKELVARALHKLGPRRAKPFIAVNVGALAETLLESELFGHEKGAFTGAAERRIGRFELADGGTLFLDEIGDIPIATQVKLLRVLEEREITRVGGTTPIAVDVRVVAATNNPLRQSVEDGRFRSDLYFRLNVLHIYLPPLRDRKDDIPILVRRFIAELSREHDRPFHGMSGDALELLVQYAWPGNVRQLRNLIESMVVLSPGREIGADDIPREIQEGGGPRLLPVPVTRIGSERDARDGGGRELEFILRSLLELKMQVEELRRRLDEEPRQASGYLGELRVAQPARDLGALAGPPAIARELGTGAPGAGIEPRAASPPPNVFVVTPGMTMAEIERSAIEAALRETRGNRRRAAEQLGIGERTLYRKLREYQLEPSGVEDAVLEAMDAGDDRA